MDANETGPAADRLAIGAEQIAAAVFDNELDRRAVYRELAKATDLGVFRVAGKLAVFVGHAREALRRRGQKKERSGPEPAK